MTSGDVNAALDRITRLIGPRLTRGEAGFHINVEPVRSEPINAEPVRIEPINAEPIKAEPAAAAPRKPVTSAA
jgi:hypothetical protein